MSVSDCRMQSKASVRKKEGSWIILRAVVSKSFDKSIGSPIEYQDIRNKNY